MKRILALLLIGFLSGASMGMTVLETGSKIRISGLGLKEQLRIVFGADVHLANVDGRDDTYLDNYRRMAQYKPMQDALDKMASRAAKADLLILGGDIMSFPSQANVDAVLASMQKSSCPWLYLNGNHDWHFEGLPGTEAQLRAEWSAKRLAPLYQGRDWKMTSLILKGVKILLIDNGTAEILPEQLDFLRKELAEQKPTLLFVHIPLFVPGRGLDFACGHPDWNAAHDPHYQIERRPRWPEKGHNQTTLEFCNTVWKAPNLIGIFAGHTHIPSMDYHQGKIQAVAPKGASGECLEITITAK